MLNEAAILRATMTDCGTFTRRGEIGEETVYDGLPCAISRAMQAATPKLNGQWEPCVETDARLGLFLPQGTVLLAGDRAEIIREGMVYRGICSAGLAYPSHVYATMLLQEVARA